MCEFAFEGCSSPGKRSWRSLGATTELTSALLRALKMRAQLNHSVNLAGNNVKSNITFPEKFDEMVIGAFIKPNLGLICHP